MRQMQMTTSRGMSHMTNCQSKGSSMAIRVSTMVCDVSSGDKSLKKDFMFFMVSERFISDNCICAILMVYNISN